MQRCSALAKRQDGQALVEAALVIPILLLLGFGVVGVGRVVQAQMGVSAVAREAARAGALASNRNEAVTRGLVTGQGVAQGYGLGQGPLELGVDPGSFTRNGIVQAAVRYRVSLTDLPLLGWVQVTVAAHHREPIDPYRSRWRTTGG